MKCGLINTLPQLNNLITTTYIFAVITGVLILLLAILIAKLIPWKGGVPDRSYLKRRVWFIILWFASVAGFFLYSNFIVMEKIKNVAFQSKFMTCIVASCIIILVLYGLLGFVIMKIIRKSKFGSILG